MWGGGREDMDNDNQGDEIIAGIYWERQHTRHCSKHLSGANPPKDPEERGRTSLVNLRILRFAPAAGLL